MKKLFVSSTFKDMQLERDSLKKHIVPELNIKLREYGVKIAQTDLRWGISTAGMPAEEGEQKVLNVCLEEINRSRPYMIVMIGERYGWIPSPAIIEMNARGRGISLVSNDISVTQLEIEYIAFTEKWDESRIFFYFRDFDYGDMDGQTRATYESESPAAAEKLSALKKRIEAKFPDQIRHYSLKYEDGEIRGIEQFEKLVTEDLYALFQRDVKEDERIDVNVRVRDKLHAEALENFKVFEAGYDIIRKKGSNIISENGKNEMTHCYIGGLPRCGKSLSVLAHYVAFYAYQHKEEACWQEAKSLFAPTSPPLISDSRFTSWVKNVDTEKTFPLYLQIGNCKDIRDDVDFLRTTLYFLNRLLETESTLPTAREELIAALCQSLRKLSHSDKCFYLFIDDLTPQALRDLFEVEHAFSEEETPLLMEHFFFYASFNDRFTEAPVYVPFYEYSESRIGNDELYVPADYFFAYARKLGKELSPRVESHIIGYYGGYGKTYEDADLTRITMSHANLMANYFMNFTSEDYRQIKAAGNDMQAIESRQLSLLNAVKGNFSDDMSGASLKKVTLLNLEKFEANHSESTMRMLGIIYILSGISFSMEEAEWIYSYFGVPWSDLEYISYFDDFKEFFLYDEEENSYRILPEFSSTLRLHFVEQLPHGQEEVTNAVQKLIAAVQSAPFYESKRASLFLVVLTVPDTDFVLRCFSEEVQKSGNDYLLGKTVGENVAELLKTLSHEEVRRLGETLAPILASHFSCDAANGFFDGIGHGFQNHVYESKIMKLAEVLSAGLPAKEDPVRATCLLSIALLKAYCYLGWKNDKALRLLFEGEPYLAMADNAKRIRFLSVLASLLRRFERESPVFRRLSGTIVRYLPPKEPLSYVTERDIPVCADMFTLAYFVKKFSLFEDYYDPDLLLEPFLNRESFSKLGLDNIDTAILAQDAKKIGMKELTARMRTFMESLSADFPSSPYACRLIGTCMLSAFFNAPEDSNATLEKYFYPYQKAVLRSDDRSAYHFVNYGQFLQNARYFHLKTGITHTLDELMWETVEMGKWPTLFFQNLEESIDVIIQVCWSYVAFLQDPHFNDMLSTDGADNTYKYGEEDSAEPSVRALHYRLTVYLAAVLHNPASRIMKPKLKRLFRSLEDYYGDYLISLSSTRYKAVKKYIESL